MTQVYDRTNRVQVALSAAAVAAALLASTATINARADDVPNSSCRELPKPVTVAAQAATATPAAKPKAPAAKPAPPKKTAASAAAMKPYTETIPGADVTFDMLPIPAGTFVMGSPDSEAGRKKDEGPQHRVEIGAFWMGKYEVTWDEYDIWSYDLDIQRREILKAKPSDRDKVSDAITRPTKPYTDMTFGMGQATATRRFR